MRFRTIAALTLAVLCLSGCLSPQQAQAYNDLRSWLDRAVAIEERGQQAGQVDHAAVASLCRTLNYGMTPDLWLLIADSVGGEYAREAESWVALDAWKRMRCTSDPVQP